MSPRPVLDREPVFRVDTATKSISRWEADGLQALGLWERNDLQQWLIADLTSKPDERTGEGLLESVVGAPEIGDAHELSGPLLLLSEEDDRWTHGKTKQPDRLDLLLLDTAGQLVVVELKRGIADETADLQALRYAAYASQLEVNDIVSMLATRLGGDLDEAQAQIAEHLGGEGTEAMLESTSNVRVVLVAEGFTPPTASTALFLYERDIDVRLVELTVRKLSEAEAAIAPRLVAPPPQAAALMVRRQRAERAEVKTRAASRRRNTDVILVENEAIASGTELRFAASLLGTKRFAPMRAWLDADPRRGLAVWTGVAGRHALRWAADGNEYSISGLTHKMFTEALGRDPGSVPGPDYWLAPGSDSLVLSTLADQLERGENRLPT